MPAPAPTFGNAAGDDLDLPEVWTTAGLSVTMFLNKPFHTQVELSVTVTCLLFWQSLPGLNQSLPRFSKAQSIFSVLVIFCCQNVNIIYVRHFNWTLESGPCLWDKTADCFKDKIEKNRRLAEKFMYFWKKSFLTRIRKNSRTLFVTRSTWKSKVCMLMRK